MLCSFHLDAKRTKNEEANNDACHISQYLRTFVR